jgi:membrane-associated phospholipid phosphatase
MLCLLNMDSLITFIAKDFILIPLFATAYVWLKLKGRQRREMLLMLVCAGILSIVFAKIGSHLYNNPRPYISDGTAPLFAHSGDPNGFPSDHTLLASFLGFVTLYYSRRIGAAILVVAALIGWARVAAHVHHLMDVVGSFVITGLACLIVINLLANKKIASKIGSRPQESRHSLPSRRSHE